MLHPVVEILWIFIFLSALGLILGILARKALEKLAKVGRTRRERKNKLTTQDD